MNHIVGVNLPWKRTASSSPYFSMSLSLHCATIDWLPQGRHLRHKRNMNLILGFHWFLDLILQFPFLILIKIFDSWICFFVHRFVRTWLRDRIATWVHSKLEFDGVLDSGDIWIKEGVCWVTGFLWLLQCLTMLGLVFGFGWI